MDHRTLRIGELLDRLRDIESERKRLKAELDQLRDSPDALETLGLPQSLASGVPSEGRQLAEPRVALFLRRFGARIDVYPQRWENKRKSTAGYSPACSNEWVPSLCGKPPLGRVRCSECPNQAFPPLDGKAITLHLAGKISLGTYAIRTDDTCIFLACDFDDQGWARDIKLFRSAAQDLGVGLLVERSRSGEGAHAWIFFDEPVPAASARLLGTLILARCAEQSPSISLDSFDRLFPNQDFLPRGGFGNLIALPFQGSSVQLGNTVFIDDDLRPLADQWGALNSVPTMSKDQLEHLLFEHVPNARSDQSIDAALARDSALLSSGSERITGLLSHTSITIRRGAQIAVPIRALPVRIVHELKKLAKFANPEFYKLQRMRMATYPHQRFIFAGELRSDALLLPRGLVEQVETLLKRAGATVELVDSRIAGTPIDVTFAGELRAEQEVALDALASEETGVLVAPPASGKTVLGCALIASRRRSTLILVHKQPLGDQWRDQVAAFLGVPKREIGFLCGSRKRGNGRST